MKPTIAMMRGVESTYDKTAKAKTGGERARAADGADLLSRLRNSIKTCAESTPEILKAVGVGSQVNPGKTSSVAESLTALLDAAKTYVEACRAAGVLDSDLTEARSILDSLLLADEDQQGAQDTKKELTAQKDAAQLRIERAVTTAAAAGQTHFRKEAAKRAVFEKLAPKHKGKGKNGGDEPPKGAVN